MKVQSNKGEHVKRTAKPWWERYSRREQQQAKAKEILATLTQSIQAAQSNSDELPKRPRRFSVDEVAEYFGVNKYTIYHWKDPRVGRIEACYDGRNLYFTKEQILACEALRATGFRRVGS